MKSFLVQALVVVVMTMTLLNYLRWFGPKFEFTIQKIEADARDSTVVYGRFEQCNGLTGSGDAAIVRCADGDVDVEIDILDRRNVYQDPVTLRFQTVLRLRGVTADQLAKGDRVIGKR